MTVIKTTIGELLRLYSLHKDAEFIKRAEKYLGIPSTLPSDKENGGES